ncbi:hypothetical protein [Streptomyces sasae]|uniref:hypothetical protein n=1 Tax=Streptomyces sasae TaxID=1266772 RepID=UPI00292D818A|nr:hypothetical protein [Streptomyces sasae]
MTTVPPPALQAPASSDAMTDHRGRQLVPHQTHLTYEQARLGMGFHEAAHAVLAMVNGMRVQASEIIAWVPEPGMSRVTGCTTTTAAADFDVWGFAALSAAGEVAELEYLMAYGLWTPERAAACSASHDRDLAIDVLAARGYTLTTGEAPAGGKTWVMVQGMARRKVTDLWSHIRTVAVAMNERTTLTGDDIAGLTGLTNPEVAA